MRPLHWIAASIALVGACAVQHSREPQPGDVGTCSSCGGGGDGSGSGSSGSGSGSAAACPLGAAAFTTVLGPSDVQQQLDLAVDASGDVAVGAAGQVNGFTELSASGSVLASLPFGSQVAVDAAGDIFIAGAFSSRIDLGDGMVLVPQGNVDVFVVELDARDHIVMAKALGLCGDGLEAIAVARDGRIAISGAAMGTVVLDAAGNLVLQLSESGHIAFAPGGQLAIAGVGGDGQAFVMMVDRAGQPVFEHVFAGSAALTGIAIDDHGNIAVVGNTESTVDLFGTQITAIFEQDVRIAGAFAVELDAAGNMTYVTPLFLAVANAVAYGPDGLAYVAAMTRGFLDVEVETSGALARVNPALRSVDFFGIAALFRGMYDAIAIDACGSVLLGGAGYQIAPPTNALIVKVSGLGPL